MMDTKEKLVEILDRFVYDEWYGNDDIAEKLISNGVTVQEWIPASAPPKDTCEYWIAYKAGGDYFYSTGYFDGKCWRSTFTHHKIPATHWMPLPQPPKGEKSSE